MKEYFQRIWLYQRERFPLKQYTPMVAAFSFCAVSYAARLEGRLLPSVSAFLVAFGVCLVFFFQLRVADEFKDYEEDSRWRPYRPVPRGLVKRWELALLFAAGMLFQYTLTRALDVRLTPVLFFAWIWLTAMSFEFGLRAWLKARPVWYLLSHMLIMPIVDFFGTACEWIPRADAPPSRLVFFLAGSFCNGIVIEFGRKIRAEQDEEPGVQTYSVLWGRRRAALLWAGMVHLTTLFGICALAARHAVVTGLPFLLLGNAFCALCVLRFAKTLASKDAKRIETASGIWTLVFYLTLGLA